MIKLNIAAKMIRATRCRIRGASAIWVSLALLCASTASAETLESIWNQGFIRWSAAAPYQKGKAAEYVVERDLKGYRFDCNFLNIEQDGKQRQRCNWLASIAEDKIDLSKVNTIELELRVEKAYPIYAITFYFKSGGGWYSHSLEEIKEGINNLELPVSKMGKEGEVAGLAAIEAIQLSVWQKFATEEEPSVVLIGNLKTAPVR